MFSGSSNQPLAAAVAEKLGIQLGKVDLTRFADGELRPWIQEDVRDKTVVVLNSLSNPIDHNVMEMVLLGDAIRRSAPKTMIAVVPYMGYSRQDKQHRVGEPVSARVIAKMLEISKYREVMSVDLHNDAIVGFFQVPVTHLAALTILADEVKKLKLVNPVVISPDVGGVKRARNFAYALDVPMVVMEKKRYLDRYDQSETFQIIGDVSGKTAIIVDDIISTGGTIVNSAKSLIAAGVKSVVVCATHAVMTGEAAKNLEAAPLETVILTDSILIPPEKRFSKLKVASLAPVIAQALSGVVG